VFPINQNHHVRGFSDVGSIQILEQLSTPIGRRLFDNPNADLKQRIEVDHKLTPPHIDGGNNHPQQILSSSNLIATPAARIHGSGYSSSGKSVKKSKPYINIKDEVTPASSRRGTTE
jgi:hypothetical protein